MKRQFPILILLLLALLPLHTHGAVPTHPGVLRLHILANSDSEADQAVKLRVRDAIRPLFQSSESYETARAYLLENGASVQRAAQSVLQECGAGYGVQLTLGTESFPDRTYEGKLFPAGDYDALIVRLGRGEGQNWWCVLFPPLCIVTETGEAVDPDTLEPESTLYRILKEWIASWNTAQS